MPNEIKGVIVQTIKVVFMIWWSQVYLCPFFTQHMANIEARLSCTNDWGIPNIEAKINKLAVTKETRVLETGPKGTISFPAVSRGPLPIIQAPTPKRGATKKSPDPISKIPAPDNGPTAFATLFVPIAKAT